jgi:hypothetical protein
MPLNIKIPRVYWAGLVSSGICLFCKVFIFSSGFFGFVLLFSSAIFLFVLGGQITFLDIEKVYHIVKQRKLKTSGSLGAKK